MSKVFREAESLRARDGVASPRLPSSSVQSPCIQVCQLDPERRTCVACLRLVDEIARWSGMTDGEKAEVLARVEQRRLGGDVPGASTR